MRQILFNTLLLATITTGSLSAQTIPMNFSRVKEFEHQLEDVMEIIDTNYLKIKLVEVENHYRENPTEINQVRLGIIYHETALNLSFFSKTEFKGFAKKSYDTLTQLFESSTTTSELLPFIASYRASALSLVGAETKKLSLLGDAFELFEQAVKNYAEVSYLPEFLRGSVAENLPGIFFSKIRSAKNDFQSIIEKQEKNENYANWKVMSFTYWAWANAHQSKKYRTQAIEFIEKAIALDPNYQAGRKKAEELKTKLLN